MSDRLLVGLIVGFSMGVCQWLALRKQIRYALLWIIASIAGWVIGQYSAVFLTDNFDDSTFLQFALLGAFVGLAQWPVLYRQVKKSGLWIIANAVGWGIGFWAAVTIVDQFFLDETWNIKWAFYWSIIAPTLSGIVTGFILVWLLRQRVQ